MTDSTAAALRTLYGAPNERAARKQMDRLDGHCRRFIAHSPFLVLSSAASDGRADVSPKGDAPGFVRVLDDRTLLIPDRTGNNRIDTLLNVVENPHVGLLFLVPGMNETLRVNGRARITREEALLAPLAVHGRIPHTALLIGIDEVFLHCAKALLRSALWDPSRHIDRGQFPSMGSMLADQIEGLDPAEPDPHGEEPPLRNPS